MPLVRPSDHVLRGRVALVTGASSGIGRAIALSIAEAGATVLAVARPSPRLTAVAAEAEAASLVVQPIACDLTDDDAVAALAERIASHPGSLDVLVHSAGSIEFGPVSEVGTGQLDRLLRANLRAPYQLTQGLLPLLAAARGDIVFINSSAGMRPSAGLAAYGASKHALRGLADALRDEVNPLGIRVTSIYPGRTVTPMQESVYRWEGRDDRPQDLLEPSDLGAIVVSILQLPRRAEVTDIHIRPSHRSEPPRGTPGQA